jgi:hypothetical protein
MNIDTIRERLRFSRIAPGTEPTNFFPYPVAPSAKRYIVAIFIVGDNVGTKTVTIDRINIDGSSTTFIGPVPVEATEVKTIPQSYDIEKPILMLEGGTNLSATASETGPTVTVIFWDDEV